MVRQAVVPLLTAYLGHADPGAALWETARVVKGLLEPFSSHPPPLTVLAAGCMRARVVDDAGHQRESSLLATYWSEST